MEQIKDSDNVLLVIDNNEEFEEVSKSFKAKHVTKTGKSFDGLDSCEFVPFDVIAVKSKSITDHKSTFSSSLKVLKPGGLLILLEVDESLQKTIQLNLTIGGYIDVVKSGSSYTCVKPSYQMGSSAKINLKKQEKGDVKSVWKIDDTEEEEDLIDPDSLLDEDDLKKPDPSSLRVCSTTGKRKACKDCSCGLADELAAEKGGKTVDTANGPKSSCGSCYLGDAFRCAECPYLGMPAFKPGEKIQLSDNQLKADI